MKKQKRLTLSRPNEATEIFFIGMGHAFYGVANLLINRGKHLLPALHSTTLTQAETLYKRVNGVISFVAENPVRAIASHTQVWLSRWYKEVRTLSLDTTTSLL